MLRILTPIVPQSSDDASLTRTDIVPDSDTGAVLVGEDVSEPDPPPHPTTPAAVRPDRRAVCTARLTLLSCISTSPVFAVGPASKGAGNVCQQRGGWMLVDRRRMQIRGGEL